jgi:hypothetical protein
VVIWHYSLRRVVFFRPTQAEWRSANGLVRRFIDLTLNDQLVVNN